MMNIIGQIIYCMIAAAVLGFIIGWIFSIFSRNEKHQKQILAVREKFDIQKAQINQLETKLDTKDREILTMKDQYDVLQKELTSREMANENDTILNSKIANLEHENLVLLEQIKEQKICEDENEILKLELKELEDEKQKLIQNIDELKEFESSYKQNIHKIAELESNQYINKITHVNEKKEKKNSKVKPEKTDDKILEDKNTLTDKVLNLDGTRKDKISNIIENLFSNKK